MGTTTELPTPAFLSGGGERPGLAVEVVPGFERRWNAWIERGRVQERQTRRRMAIAVPILVIAAVIVYALLG
jgi:hypothetical protein